MNKVTIPVIGQEVVVAPVVTQVVVVAPGIDEAYAATGISLNTGYLFLKAALSNDRDELIEWCKKVALNVGFSMVIEKSDKGNGDRHKPFFILDCERGVVYKEPKRKLKREDTATRKCDCPFRLRGYFLTNKQWKLSVVNGEHNHEMAKNLECHILAGRLKPKEKECVHQLTRNLVSPKTILNTLREKNKESKTNMKQIYNNQIT
ncbi:protein FAR1-RELATED SEQUENCE [Trifolium repens]|nr:protein FAR1-RELATED SEQUENCE [Trifolium repens]